MKSRTHTHKSICHHSLGIKLMGVCLCTLQLFGLPGAIVVVNFLFQGLQKKEDVWACVWVILHGGLVLFHQYLKDPNSSRQSRIFNQQQTWTLNPDSYHSTTPNDTHDSHNLSGIIPSSPYTGMTEFKETWLAIGITCRADWIFRRDLVRVDVMSQGIV